MLKSELEIKLPIAWFVPNPSGRSGWQKVWPWWAGYMSVSPRSIDCAMAGIHPWLRFQMTADSTTLPATLARKWILNYYLYIFLPASTSDNWPWWITLTDYGNHFYPFCKMSSPPPCLPSISSPSWRIYLNEDCYLLWWVWNSTFSVRPINVLIW